MKTLHKLGYSKAIDENRKSVKAYVSTFEWDRQNERFSKGAWDLENFKKNPVVFWGHDHFNPPIGKAVSIEETPDGLFAETVFDTETQKGAEIFSLYSRGFLNAFSVGFVPKTKESIRVEYMGDGKAGTVYKSVELLEYSAVSIPANPGALITREEAEMVTKALGDGHVRQVMRDGVEKWVVNGGDDFAIALKNIIDISRTVKRDGLDVQKLSLINTTIDTLQEITTKNECDISQEHLDRLGHALDAYAQVACEVSPETSELLNKTLRKIDDALKMAS